MQSQLFLMGIIKLLLLFICENIGSKHLKFLLLLLVSVCVLFVCMCVCFFAVCVIGLFICSCASYLNMFKFFCFLVYISIQQNKSLFLLNYFKVNFRFNNILPLNTSLKIMTFSDRTIIPFSHIFILSYLINSSQMSPLSPEDFLWMVYLNQNPLWVYLSRSLTNQWETFSYYVPKSLLTFNSSFPSFPLTKS